MTSLVSLARMPSLFSFLPADMPRRPALHDEGRDAAVPLRPVGDRDDHHDAADPAVRDERLRAVDHPALALPDCRRAHAGRVAPGARFGEAPGPPHLAADEPRQVLLLLRGAPERRDVGGAQTVVRRDRERHRGTHARQFFDADAVVDRRERRAAVFLWKLNAGEPERRELRQEIVGELLRLVPLHDVWTDLGFREFADRPAQQFLLLSRAKVHGNENVSCTVRGSGFGVRRSGSGFGVRGSQRSTITSTVNLNREPRTSNLNDEPRTTNREPTVHQLS